jgi:hypothetical protein
VLERDCKNASQALLKFALLFNLIMNIVRSVCTLVDRINFDLDIMYGQELTFVIFLLHCLEIMEEDLLVEGLTVCGVTSKVRGSDILISPLV